MKKSSPQDFNRRTLAFIQTHQFHKETREKKLDNPLLSMKPYHFHQLLEDIQIYVCTNGPGLFEMKNFMIWLGSISTETIIV